MTDIVTAGLSFSYPGAASPAVRDLTLTTRAGEVTWLFGALGAGCSTLLLLMAGLAPRVTGGRRDGSVTVGGIDPGEPAGGRALAGRVAYVTASPRVQLSGVAQTVRQEVAFAPANLGWPVDRITRATDAALDALEIAHLAERDPGSVSGGELQRVVLAAMLVLEPDAWLLDEPAAELDPAGRARLYGLLRTEAARGAVVVVASEDADGFAGAVERCVILEAGAVALDGTPREVLADDRTWDLGAGSTTVAAVARAARAIVDAPALAPPYPLTVEEGIARWR